VIVYQPEAADEFEGTHQFRSMITDIQSTVGWWESATVGATVVSAVLTALSSILAFGAYFKKKWPNKFVQKLDDIAGLERFSLTLGVLAANCALAGAFCSIEFTIANRQQQRLAEADNLSVHQQLIQAQTQSARASETANRAATELSQTEGRLTRAERELIDADQQLAIATDHLNKVEAEVNWRTLNRRQRNSMITILSKWKGTTIDFHPIAGDPEIYSFATEIRSVLEKAGWQLKWSGFLGLQSGVDQPPSEGIRLRMPTSRKDEDVMRDLVKALRIADPRMEITYNLPEQDPLHLTDTVVGKRHAPQTKE
jgi:hypothetical protein